MSRCVPNWDLDDDDAPSAAARTRFSFLGPDLPSVDCEVAELTWENGQLSLHGLGQSRLNSKPVATSGTLESLMSQAAAASNQAVPIAGCKHSFAYGTDLVPWFDPSQAPTDVVVAPSAAMMMDAQVPCATTATADPHRQAMWLLADSVAHGTGDCGCGSARVGSCSAMGSGDGGLLPPTVEERRQGSRKRTRCDSGSGRGEWGDHQSVSGSAAFSHRVTTLDTYECERELENATSEGSPENTDSGKGSEGRAVAATTEENDSVYSRPLREEEVTRRIRRSSLSTKRSRAAAIHNQSERKRRDKINQRMKTLQKLVPNSSKTDKASVLDEVIDYLKQLQAQVQVMSRMNMMPSMPMMPPLALQQQLQLSMMAAPMGLGLGLGLAGMPGVMSSDMSALGVAGRPNIPGMPPVYPFMPMAPWDAALGARFNPVASGPVPMMPDPLSAFLAGQSPPGFDMQAMTMDAYSRLAAIYQQQHHQQHQQQHPHNPNN